MQLPSLQIPALDTRSLAWMRMGLGAILLLDLAERARHLSEHYTDEGLIPINALRSIERVASLHTLSGEAGWQVFLFLLAGAAALALMLGYRTRVATVVSWILLVSLHHRNPYLLHMGDALMRGALFWAIFLPLDRKPGIAVRSVAGLGLILHLGLVFAWTALLKSGTAWTQDGTAVWLALSSPEYAGWLAPFITAHPEFSAPLTFAVLGWEWSVLPLLLSPWRKLGVASVVAFAAALQLTMNLGLIPITTAIVALGCLPPEDPQNTEPSEPLALRAALAAVIVLTLIPTPALHTVGLHFRWNMFAPAPPDQGGYYLAVATLDDGRRLDLFTGEKWEPTLTTWKKPLDMRRKMLGFHIFKRNRNQRLKPVVAHALCRRSGARFIELIYFAKDLVPFAEQPLVPQTVYRHICEGL